MLTSVGILNLYIPFRLLHSLLSKRKKKFSDLPTVDVFYSQVFNFLACVLRLLLSQIRRNSCRGKGTGNENHTEESQVHHSAGRYSINKSLNYCDII